MKRLDEDREPYGFEDFLNTDLSRDQAEYKWHKEKQAPDKHTYDPDESQIDFQGPTYEEWQNDENTD